MAIFLEWLEWIGHTWEEAEYELEYGTGEKSLMTNSPYVC